MNEKNHHFLITGAAGFIGHALTKKLILQNIPVIAVDGINEYYDPNLKLDRLKDLENTAKSKKAAADEYKFFKIDLKNKDKLDELFSNYNINKICHLAAQAGVRYSLSHPQSYIDNNITATLNLLECSRDFDVTDITFSSTSSVYGLSENMPFRETESISSVISPYSASKRACELMLHTYNHLFGIRIKILRFFTVYGPWGRPDMALFKFTKAILEGKPIEVYNSGRMQRDFTYIDDIVDGIISSLMSEYDFEIFNLGCGNPINLMDFILHLEEVLGIESKKIMLGMQSGDVKSTWADISKARELLQYAPQTDYKLGIENFVKWYKTYYSL
jgi:UDP-glucuronate 4-epimerase